MRRIETPRLLLRNFAPSDWRPLQAMVVRFMASPMGAYDHQWPTDDAGVQGACNWFASGDDLLAICLRDGGAFLGYVALNPLEEAGVYNLGYCLDEPYRGQGYATEACAALIEHAFGALGATRLVSGTAAANEPSCRLLRRLGLEVVSESYGPAFRNDADGNPIMGIGYEFALTRAAWEARRAGAAEGSWHRMEFDELYEIAKGVVNPHRLSEYADAGGVGAALVAEDGNVYTGVCIDTTSGMGFCAEHAAGAAMVTAGASRVLRMVAVGWDGKVMPPCGRCREFIRQLDPRNLEAEVLVAKGKVVTLAELLPYPFE